MPDLVGLFILALIVRGLAAAPQQQPSYMDALYSYVNAQNLAAGRGFVEDFVWNYLGNPPPPPPPGPSHLYWMPLTSMLAWLGMSIAGVSYRAAQLPFVVLSALLAPLSYTIVWALNGKRWQGWLAGLLAIFSGFYFPFWTAIDNFTPFAIAGSLALLLAWRGLVGGRGAASEAQAQSKVPASAYFFASGLCVGLAHLARADGPLLLIAILLFLWWSYLFLAAPHAALHASRPTPHALRFTFFLILGYLLVMLPWFLRNWQVTGAWLPAAGSQTIWLTDYDDLFSYGRELSPRTFLAQGLGPILQGRWWALTANFQTVLAVWGMIFLAPLVVVGGWHLRRHGLIQLAGLYALLLFLVMTLIFAFPGARGGLFHSGAALLPFVYAVSAVGLEVAVEWAAARRRRWDARLAKQFFGVSMVLLAVALSSFTYYNRVLKNDAWNQADQLYPAIAGWVNQQDPTATVMINNPPAYRYHGGGLSVVIPNEKLTVTLQAARQYRVDYLILDANHPAPLADLYNHPENHPGLSLVKTFGNVYVFEIVEP